jgi:hypothetical protein
VLDSKGAFRVVDAEISGSCNPGLQREKGTRAISNPEHSPMRNDLSELVAHCALGCQRFSMLTCSKILEP